MKTQFVTDHHGNKIAVILPIKTYQKILAKLEEADAVNQYDAVKARKEESVLFSEYLKKRRRR